MRSLIQLTLAAALAAVTLTSPAAASVRHHRHHTSIPGEAQEAATVAGFPGYGTGPYWQGEPTDNLPIWRYGYYQGTDPDPFIRSQLMRDPTNH
jgi:hypothetical protein